MSHVSEKFRRQNNHSHNHFLQKLQSNFRNFPIDWTKCPDIHPIVWREHVACNDIPSNRILTFLVHTIDRCRRRWCDWLSLHVRALARKIQNYGWVEVWALAQKTWHMMDLCNVLGDPLLSLLYKHLGHGNRNCKWKIYFFSIKWKCTKKNKLNFYLNWWLNCSIRACNDRPYFLNETENRNSSCAESRNRNVPVF